MKFGYLTFSVWKHIKSFQTGEIGHIQVVCVNFYTCSWFQHSFLNTYFAGGHLPCFNWLLFSLLMREGSHLTGLWCPVRGHPAQRRSTAVCHIYSQPNGGGHYMSQRAMWGWHSDSVNGRGRFCKIKGFPHRIWLAFWLIPQAGREVKAATQG